MLSVRKWIFIPTLCAMLATSWHAANAAEMTDVADAADTIVIGETKRQDFFDIYVGARFRMLLANGKMTREPIVRPGVSTSNCESVASSRDCLPVDEMRWKRDTSVLDIDTQIGLFHDLAATLAFHYVFSDLMAIRYAQGVQSGTSSVDPKTGDANDTLFPLGTTAKSGFRSKHKGWGNIDNSGYRTGGMDFGLRWAPLNDERDNSKPAWVLVFDWSNPWLSKVFNPSMRATGTDPGGVGDGVHYLTFGTALSKRIASFGLIDIDPKANRRGFIDPYMDFRYTLPVPQKGRALKTLTASRANFGRKPSHKAELNAGMEVVAVEDLKQSRKVAIDIGMRTAFFTEGRNYSELTDALGELTYTEQFFHVAGLLGLYIQAAEFLRFKAGVSLGYTSEHFLTFEEVGSDGVNGPADGQVLPEDPADKINPYFCGNDPDDRCASKGLPSYDQIGFRFKDEEHTVFGWFVTLQLTL